jgi:hypothetical protein
MPRPASKFRVVIDCTGVFDITLNSSREQVITPWLRNNYPSPGCFLHASCERRGAVPT